MIPRFATFADVGLVGEICSHPEVRRWTAHDGAPPFEAGRWFKGKNLVVLCDGGVFLSNWLGDRTWEVHTNILPEARGAGAFTSAGLSLMLAFLSTDVESFVTKVPGNNRPAKWFTNAMGFRPTFLQKAKWLSRGNFWNVRHYRLDIDDWILQGHLVPVGQAFHQDLEVLGHKEHAEDYAHDCYVGATIAMLGSGKPGKAIRIYNRWAYASGYAPLTLVSTLPLVIDAQDFIIHYEGGKMMVKSKELEHA